MPKRSPEGLGSVTYRLFPSYFTFSERGVALEALEALDVEDAVPRLHD